MPYKKDPVTGAVTVNTDLLTYLMDANGNPVDKNGNQVSINNAIPELDDPDFFRHVSTSDVNWLSPKHDLYSASDVAAHNTRVDNWVKLAKPVITAPDIDLIQLPHSADGSIQYDSGTPTSPGADACTTAGVCGGVAHSGTAFDPVTGKVYPIVNTTVTFRPAVVEGDAAPATTTEYSSIGLPANAADNGGLPYIPTLFTATSQSWSFPYTITLYPQHVINNQLTPDTSDYFQTALDTTGQTGDIFEYHFTGGATGTPVYDVTAGKPVTGQNTYVPMTVNPDSGTINFAQPALRDPTDPTSRFWQIPVTAINGTITPPAYINTNTHIVDLTQLTNSPLVPNAAPTGTQVANAHIVPGSLRVYGPDSTPGPNLGNSVLYSLVSQGTPLTYNEYRADYLTSQLQFYVDPNTSPANKLQETTNAGNYLSARFRFPLTTRRT